MRTPKIIPRENEQMKRLMTIAQFREQHFAKGSAPTEKTLKGWIESGDLTGQKIGGRYYVDVSAFDAPTSNNPLVLRVLKTA